MARETKNRAGGSARDVRWLALCAIFIAVSAAAHAADGMQRVGRFLIDRMEVTVGRFHRFAQATGFVTKAEKDGGGRVYAAGWKRKPGWTWRAPFGTPAGPDEPAVHVTYDEAEAFCRWAGKRLPTDAEWTEAAYVEQRDAPPAPFVNGRSYSYPTGDAPFGANCLGDCGRTPALDHSGRLERGRGHALAGATTAGVNGLFDMGANVWEWVDAGDAGEKRTRGGSWWYGAAEMRRDHLASKPRDMAVVYIGFRCARDVR